MNCIAVIPARAGSKRIPNKNIYEIMGKPVIAYAISNALNSGLFSQVFVSTDSPEIAKIAQSFGATVGKLREPNLSGDHATTIEVISGFVASDLEAQIYPDFICCIYPVTPLLTTDRLQESFNLVREHPSNFVFAATPTDSHPGRNFRIDKNLQAIFEYGNQVDARTQDLGLYFQDAGQFYWGATKTWVESESILGRNCRAVKLKKYEVVDVDEIEDMKLVEMLLKAKV